MGHVRRTKGGGWQARYRDPTGRERARTFIRRVDAERFLNVIETDKLRGQWLDPEAGKVTVAEFSERWYATTVSLKPKTRAGYRSLLDSRILPYLGHLQLRQVDPLVVREWVADLQDADLSASRIRQARNVIHAIFGLAQQSSRIVRNPVEGVKTPPLPASSRRFLTPEQVQQLAVSIPDPYDVLVYLLAYTGIRLGRQRPSADPDVTFRGHGSTSPSPSPKWQATFTSGRPRRTGSELWSFRQPSGIS